MTSLRCFAQLARLKALAPITSARKASRSFRTMPAIASQQHKSNTESKANSDEVLKTNDEETTLRRRSGRTFSPFDALGTSGLRRISQMAKELEDEMIQMSHAFGMPLMRPFEPFELPGTSFDMPSGARAIACDVKDKGNYIEIQADVPGMTKDEIKVTVTPDKVLQIKGERKFEIEEGEAAEGHWRVERSFGSFIRRFRLPENVDLEGIKAQMNDGVLKLDVPKTKEARPNHIEIKLE